ncbi:DMT family transporter [Lacihabitans soyangensis]|uniref:DMT family transporter n=1 Tax=Lacihabitans soyangensis TaxID=869394 RepID=A0AAE3GZ93_9BACT|nr:DMT family transporter [Lacihabitans soyangensis]MCP9762049.1 DMT family transporter [Lacihabitans soyangensis]
MKKTSTSLQFILLGIVFAIFWSSASVAAKIGVKSMEPLVLFQFRFFLAGILLLAYHAVFEKWQWPNRQEVIALGIFGFLNVTLYLTLFVLAINEVAAGIGSLSVSLGPVLMAIIGGLILGKKIEPRQIFGLLFGIGGVFIAVWPLLQNSFATFRGLTYLFIGMLSYSLAAVYFSEKKWNLSRYAINGWQVLFGGIFMLPLTFYFKKETIQFSTESILSILWLTIPVSLLAVNLWLKLIKIDAIKAAFFLFLCPIFGFTFSSFILKEPFTWHTMVGLILVLIGLYLGQERKINQITD